MTVVADAYPLIALARIGRLDLLRGSFGALLVPEAVWHEVAVADLHKRAGFWFTEELRRLVVGQ